MLEPLLEELKVELNISSIKSSERPLSWNIYFPDDICVSVRDAQPGIHLQSIVATLPETHRETIYMKLLQINFLGQGTGNGFIGIDRNEECITLSLLAIYDVNYTMFKEQLEEHLNYLSYWKEEVQRLKKEES